MRLQLFFIALITILVSCSSTHEPKSSILFPYWDKAGGFLSKFKYKAGYMDLDGNKVIDSKYVEAEPFTEGLGCVGIPTDSGVFYGYIDSAANYVITPRFANARPFQDNRALVRENYHSYCWGVINRKGEFITDKVFSLVTDYYNGYCYGWIKAGTEEATRFEKAITGIETMGLLHATDHVFYDCYKIDTSGKATLVEPYTEKTDQGNYIRVKEQNNLGMFWRGNIRGYGFTKISVSDFEIGEMNYAGKGTGFIEPIYKNVENFQYGYARVTFDNNDKGYIDTTGKVILRFREDRPY